MGAYTSYFLYQRYEKRGNQDWVPYYPNTYSVSGDSEITMPISAKSEYDTACGYTPKGSDDYNYEKWEVVDGYVCEDTTKYTKERKYVSDDNTTWTATDIYRKGSQVITYYSTDCGYNPEWSNYNCTKWEAVSGEYICDEGNKYEKLRKYFRQCADCNDCNSSWSGSSIYKLGNIISYDSTDCGYVVGERMYRWVNMTPSSNYYCDECPYVPPTPPTPPTFQGKWKATYTGGTTSSAACDASSAITTNSIPNKTNLVEVEIGNCVTSIGDNAFKNSTKLTTCTIGNGLTNIGESAFYMCSGLTSITIPDSVTSIGAQAFCYCFNISSCTISSGVTSIGDSAFRDCHSLTSVTIPDSVTSMGYSVFSGCKSLISCTIGSGVTTINESAFYNCSGLTSITVNATTPPTLGRGVFYDTNDCPIYVPSASVNAYKTASRWSNYASRIQAIPT